mgnify:FL=1
MHSLYQLYKAKVCIDIRLNISLTLVITNDGISYHAKNYYGLSAMLVLYAPSTLPTERGVVWKSDQSVGVGEVGAEPLDN